MKIMRKGIKIFSVVLMAVALLVGCSRPSGKENNDNVVSDNIIITETGEVIQKEPKLTEKPVDTEQIEAESADKSESVISEIQLTEPEQEQVVTEDDQIMSSGSNLQIVFLGDSIFDSNRDGTGVPYLTAKQCAADLYNLAIGGTSASIDIDEQRENELWTSTSLMGVIKAMEGDIPTDIFQGTRTKELLDDTDIDWSVTDYFVVEYGLNDFFKAAPLSNDENGYDMATYAGALRCAVSTLKSIAPDATVILCGPNYARFFSGNWMIGDGNTLNTGYGTLADYKGICEYIAGEQQAEFFDAYLGLGIDGYTAEEYLEDGVHLTEAGRQLYADALARKILDYEKNKNN